MGDGRVGFSGSGRRREAKGFEQFLLSFPDGHGSKVFPALRLPCLLPTYITLQNGFRRTLLLTEGYIERRFPRRAGENRKKRLKHQTSLASIPTHFSRKHPYGRHCVYRC